MPPAPFDDYNPLTDIRGEGRVIIGFSGGLDSVVLLDLALAAGLQARLSAIHVDHGLQPESSGWADHCRRLCDACGVPLQVERVVIHSSRNLEEQARDARYRCFSRQLGENDCLLLAHHGDDQAETLLLRLLRGTGVRGLAGMPSRRSLGAGRLWRPLLKYTRAQLEQYAQERGLSWIDDPSNDDVRFDRNFLRSDVVPRLKARWPGLVPQLLKAASWQREADQLLGELAAMDAAVVVSDEPHVLRLPAMWALSEARQRNLIRHWLRGQGAQVPESRSLQQFLLDLQAAGSDRQPRLVWGDWALSRYQNRLYLGKAQMVMPPVELAWPLYWSSPALAERSLIWGDGQLRATPSSGQGLYLPDGAQVQVRLRQGGECLRLAGRSGTRTLKKLLQEADVPPWLRQQMPLIYVNGELAAVAGYWIAEGFEAENGQSGWQIEWTPG